MKKKIPSILQEIRSFEPPEIDFAYHKTISYSKKTISKDTFQMMNDNASPLNLNFSHVEKIVHGNYGKVHIDFHSNLIMYISITVVVTIVAIVIFLVVMFCLYKKCCCCKKPTYRDP